MHSHVAAILTRVTCIHDSTCTVIDHCYFDEVSCDDALPVERASSVRRIPLRGTCAVVDKGGNCSLARTVTTRRLALKLVARMCQTIICTIMVDCALVQA
jgi:hypothetical protein